MTFLQALILGAVQGITEFLPISSTAHLRVIPALFGWADPGAAYSAVIQLGTTAAVMVYFREDIFRVSAAFLAGLRDRKPMGTEDSRLAWYVGLGTIPVVVLGLTLKKLIETEFRSLHVIAWAAIALAVVLLVAERFAKHARELHHLNLRDALLIGLAQAVALIPGASRSGVTLTAGLLLGLRRDAAARYSFLLSIPATAGAGLFELKHLVEALRLGQGPGVMAMVVGTAVSFGLGYLSIAGLLRFLRTQTTMVFVVYRVALGAGLLLMLGAGLLTP